MPPNSPKANRFMSDLQGFNIRPSVGRRTPLRNKLLILRDSDFVNLSYFPQYCIGPEASYWKIKFASSYALMTCDEPPFPSTIVPVHRTTVPIIGL